MDILIRLLMVFEAVVCLLLIGIVLLQRSKGQGAGLSFGGGAEAVFGAQVGNVLTRATVVLAVLFLANTTLLTVLRPQDRQARSVTQRRAATPARPERSPADAPAMPRDDADFERQIAELLETAERGEAALAQPETPADPEGGTADAVDDPPPADEAATPEAPAAP